MADPIRAADLPDHSVVADNTTAYIKNHPSKTAQWRGTNGGWFGHWRVDEVLAEGGRVLRVGTDQPTAEHHSACPNCEGVDPASCAFNLVEANRD